MVMLLTTRTCTNDGGVRDKVWADVALLHILKQLKCLGPQMALPNALMAEEYVITVGSALHRCKPLSNCNALLHREPAAHALMAALYVIVEGTSASLGISPSNDKARSHCPPFSCALIAAE
eukprot:CAMPEP_0204549822 /NCGR_PEP_ID=MMETSP0661-20131031/24640_1 /ASSEMBLY_ACC=CAM_ASM_000606 /TAXON_ID=109239 /ORGANISM="Alexandrium margalefi, Strain AMGDE01CS-322" /LENGTH=120 /DNA_ID=CAMNT_0051556775 /DNA_START=87 /DNA_END=450 /DNA_ORIENTATION=+